MKAANDITDSRLFQSSKFSTYAPTKLYERDDKASECCCTHVIPEDNCVGSEHHTTGDLGGPLSGETEIPKSGAV
jgi:hypothetical protein